MFNRLVKRAMSKIDTTRFCKKDYINNAEKISDANEKMFFSAVYIMTVLYTALLIASMFVGGLSSNRNLYITGILFAATLVVRKSNFIRIFIMAVIYFMHRIFYDWIKI